jgi:hypothetical protein
MWNAHNGGAFVPKFIVFDFGLLYTFNLFQLKAVADTTHSTKEFSLSSSISPNGPWTLEVNLTAEVSANLQNFSLPSIIVTRFLRVDIVSTYGTYQPYINCMDFGASQITNFSGTFSAISQPNFMLPFLNPACNLINWNDLSPSNSVHYVSYDLQATVVVTGFSLNSFGDTTHDLKDFSLLYYDTLQGKFVTVGNYTAFAGVSEPQIFSVSSTVSARYWQILITSTFSSQPIIYCIDWMVTLPTPPTPPFTTPTPTPPPPTPTPTPTPSPTPTPTPVPTTTSTTSAASSTPTPSTPGSTPTPSTTTSDSSSTTSTTTPTSTPTATPTTSPTPTPGKTSSGICVTPFFYECLGVLSTGSTGLFSIILAVVFLMN